MDAAEHLKGYDSHPKDCNDESNQCHPAVSK